MVIVLGLGSRRYADALPTLIARYAGDTLWATAAYVGLSVAWPGARARWLAAGAALISLTVELSQLARPAWLQTVRRWPGAPLLLGYGFLASDLVCYAVGVALGTALDHSVRLADGWWSKRLHEPHITVRGARSSDSDATHDVQATTRRRG